jgi:lipopolysaccharide export system protein LptC
VRLLGLLSLIAAAIFTGWLVDRVDSTAPRPEEARRHDPDYYMENFSQLSMDPGGGLDNKLQAEFMVHYLDDDSSELVRPRLELYNDSRPPWIVVAERGWVSAGNEVILLYGPVEIWRNHADGEREVEVLTTNLRILADEDYAESDYPTTIRSRTTTTHAVGMRARFGKGHLELLERVRSRHHSEERG